MLSTGWHHVVTARTVPIPSTRLKVCGPPSCPVHVTVSAKRDTSEQRPAYAMASETSARASLRGFPVSRVTVELSNSASREIRSPQRCRMDVLRPESIRRQWCEAKQAPSIARRTCSRPHETTLATTCPVTGLETEKDRLLLCSAPATRASHSFTVSVPCWLVSILAGPLRRLHSATEHLECVGYVLVRHG